MKEPVTVEEAQWVEVELIVGENVATLGVTVTVRDVEGVKEREVVTLEVTPREMVGEIVPLPDKVAIVDTVEVEDGVLEMEEKILGVDWEEEERE